MIEIKNISKEYFRGTEVFTALKDISFRIDKGDFCSVTGPSGAGKSTLLYIIGGLIHPDSGAVIYNGNDIYKLNSRNINLYRRKNLGFMFQQFHLMPYLTVTGNIRLACNGNSKSQAEKIAYYLEKCSLTDIRNKYPSELSVGEKQRTAFIRAIISEPEILLADEPTGNLDASNSDILMSLVKDYNNGGGTVVMVSHDHGIGKYSNRCIILRQGSMQ
ncbi:MAG: ABC transporter ATP-binding protein [Bacteroidia bacterium]|nr:MAG: ABC transporter ATP-binding protein [Bacteroidia bacterium]